MDTANYADIIFFAIMAGFILFKLYSTLGKHGGTPPKAGTKGGTNAEAMAQWLQNRSAPAATTTMKEAEMITLRTDKDNLGKRPVFTAPVQQALQQITAADSQFDVEYFMQGAQNAYEIVIKAFNSGDKETLRMLLSPEVYDAFMKQFDSLKAQGYTENVTIVSVDQANITQAALNGFTARIEVAFASQQVIVTKDTNGRVVEGDPTQAERVEDAWVFQRDVTSAEPTWVIVST